jgi:agmatine deiminase
MTDLKVNRRTLPDWHSCKAIVLVYPFRVQEREHLMPFYEQLMTYIPKEIKIILLVKDISCQADVLTKHAALVIENEIEFVEFPRIFDIWVRDYAPLVVDDQGIHIPVKFNYNPSYVEKKYARYIQHDNLIGEELGKRFVSEGIRSLYFNWDMGNLTHNGAGTAIISNRFIADNETSNVDHELRTMLHVFCGLSNIVFIPTEPDDSTGHVDGMCRFIDEKVLVVGAYPLSSPNHQFMETLAENLQNDLGDDYSIIRLQNGEPEDQESEGVASAYGNHLNFLRINDLILFPYYGDEISSQPMEDFKGTLKEHELSIQVIPVELPEIKELARAGGVLNCISWQVFSE